ncbi:hypothetical protein EDB19DRAFT_1340296 [Suillus lakei]|nr:hypothetical protein EDB19DRAFT_1340296 [Suillus lakei]
MIGALLPFARNTLGMRDLLTFSLALILQLVACPTHDPEEPGQGAPINGATATAAVILRALSGTQTCALALVASPNQSRVTGKAAIAPF